MDTGDDTPLPRCAWADGASPLDVQYHDCEWGVPQRDPAVLFELLVLEGAQAGLSWSTILHRREGYRAAFAGFDPVRIATFGEDDVARCLADRGIIRNRAKITSTIGNARAWLELDDPSAHLWSFVGGVPIDRAWRLAEQVPAQTEESLAMSKDLKRRGFRFVGPTICYAWMQACGLVNDHLVGCFRYEECAAAGQ